MFPIRALFFTVVFASVTAAGCGGKQNPEPATPTAKKDVDAIDATEKPTAPTKESVPNTPTASGVKISDEIAKACGISGPEAFFAFDSAHIRPADAKPLDKLAECFKSGPMKDHKMKIVGHADVRGDSDYNVQLGLSRANSVAGYMFDKGLDKAKAATTSRGAMDATGKEGDEEAMARDRRVDVLLGD